MTTNCVTGRTTEGTGETELRREKMWRTLIILFGYLKASQEEKSTFISFDLRKSKKDEWISCFS